jgi:hypothetical protein
VGLVVIGADRAELRIAHAQPADRQFMLRKAADDTVDGCLSGKAAPAAKAREDGDKPGSATTP